MKLEQIERLSRGKSSGIRIGSRAVGHHLRPHERKQYEHALKKGYLEITERDRANLWHIWQKASMAKGWDFLILVKETENDLGLIYQQDRLIESLPLKDAKQHIQLLAKESQAS